MARRAAPVKRSAVAFGHRLAAPAGSASVDRDDPPTRRCRMICLTRRGPQLLAAACALARAARARRPAWRGARRGRPAFDPDRVRLLRPSGQAAADLGCGARLPAGAVHLRRRQRLWRPHAGRADAARRCLRQGGDGPGLPRDPRAGAGAGGLGRSRLRPERCRRRFPVSGGGEGAVPRLLADRGGRPETDPRGHLLRADLRPRRHAPAGDPAWTPGASARR